MTKAETTSLRLELRYQAIIELCRKKQLKQFGANPTKAAIVKEALDIFAERQGISQTEITIKESELSEEKENRNMKIQIPSKYAGVIFELTTLEEYQRCVRGGSGYIWPQDHYTKGKIHPVRDTHHNSHHFRTKIEINEMKNGQYFFSEDLEALREWSGADPCHRCPEQKSAL